MYGIAGAWATISLLTAANASARAVGSVSAFAFSSAALTSGSSSSDQFTLLASRISLPLNVGSSTVCGSAKSCDQPYDGQTLTSEPDTWQNFVSIVSRVTRRSLV